MAYIKKEITVQLQQPVEYHSGGKVEDGTFVVLNAPTSKNLLECSQIKQQFLRAIAGLRKNNPGEAEQVEDEGEGDDGSMPSGKEIIDILYLSDIEVPKMLLQGAALFKNVGKLDGEVKLTQPLIDSISIPDLEVMLGEYISNFILASV